MAEEKLLGMECHNAGKFDKKLLKSLLLNIGMNLNQKENMFDLTLCCRRSWKKYLWRL